MPDFPAVRLDSLPAGTAFRFWSGVLAHVGQPTGGGAIWCGPSAHPADTLVCPLPASETAALVAAASRGFADALKARVQAEARLLTAQDTEYAALGTHRADRTDAAWLAYLAALDQHTRLQAAAHQASATQAAAERALAVAQRAHQVATASTVAEFASILMPERSPA